MGWDAVLARALSGSHQSLEPAFSTEQLWLRHEHRPFLDGLRVTGEDVFRKYGRTMKKFAFGDVQRRRHAVRLAGGRMDLRRRGRFDPRLSYREAAFASNLVENLAGHALAGVLRAQF